MTNPTIFHISLKTVSESNCTENWRSKSKRHKIQKNAVNIFFTSHDFKINMPCHVILTRISPRKLDEGDNLPASFKYIRDAVAENITGDIRAGRADGDSRITWEYSQRRGEPKTHMIQIEIIEK